MARALIEQRPAPSEILIIDSESDDGSPAEFARRGIRVLRVERRSFDHGGTRNLALEHLDAPVIVYLTQDAIPTGPTSLSTLAGALDDERVGLAYGRQIARPSATAATQVHREFIYPRDSFVVRPGDVQKLGVAAGNVSNAFAAYRRDALDAVGRFPGCIIGNEDRWAAGRLLARGWSISYVADAVVEHSHDYDLLSQLRRYFDAGVFEAMNPWYEEMFGRPHARGRQLVRRQLSAARGQGGARAQARVLALSASAPSDEQQLFPLTALAEASQKSHPQLLRLTGQQAFDGFHTDLIVTNNVRPGKARLALSTERCPIFGRIEEVPNITSKLLVRRVRGDVRKGRGQFRDVGEERRDAGSERLVEDHAFHLLCRIDHVQCAPGVELANLLAWLQTAKQDHRVFKPLLFNQVTKAALCFNFVGESGEDQPQSRTLPQHWCKRAY
jgi:rhamnosyltransferase